MSGGQKVSDQTLKHLEDQMGLKYESVGSQIKTLQKTIDEAEAVWQGLGSNAFGKKQGEINDHLRSLGRTLDKFIKAINQTRGIKDASEQTVDADMRKIDAGLGNTHSALNGL